VPRWPTAIFSEPGLKHRRTWPYWLRTNGNADRFIQMDSCGGDTGKTGIDLTVSWPVSRQRLGSASTEAT